MAKKPDTILINGTEVIITYTKAGKMDAKTRGRIAEAQRAPLLKRAIPSSRMEEIVDASGFVMLTVGIKYGLIDPLQYIFGAMGVDLASIKKAVEAAQEAGEFATERMKDWIDPDALVEPLHRLFTITPGTVDKVAKEQISAEAWADRLTLEQAKKQRDTVLALEPSAIHTGALKKLDDTITVLEGKRYDHVSDWRAFVKKLELLDWAAAGGISWGIKLFLQNYTVPKAIENIPLVQ